MVSFKEYYENKHKMNEAADVTFEDLIKQKGSKFRSSKESKAKAKEIIKRADKELVDGFLSDASQKKVDTKTSEYKDLALAIEVLATNPNKEAKEILSGLGIEPGEGEKFKDLPEIKNIKAGTKELIKTASAVSTEEPDKPAGTPPAKKPEEETPEEEPEEEEEPETKTPVKPPVEKPEFDKTANLIARSKKAEKVAAEKAKGSAPDASDTNSPSSFAKQAQDLLDAKIEDLNASTEGSDDLKKVKMKKVITDMEAEINKKIAKINKQQSGYSANSNFSSRLKATTNSKNLFNEIKNIANRSSNKVVVKGLKTRMERTGEKLGRAGKAVVKGVEKVAGAKATQAVKEKVASVASGVQKVSAEAKRVAAPVVSKAVADVKSKVKTTGEDTIVKKWLPNEFEAFVRGTPEQQAEILARAKNERDSKRAEADKARRISRQRVKKVKETKQTPPPARSSMISKATSDKVLDKAYKQIV